MIKWDQESLKNLKEFERRKLYEFAYGKPKPIEGPIINVNTIKLEKHKIY